jgi:predicted anti-sigma-YlaC factor YlaD
MSGMTCKELVELVTAYLDGALDTETEAHLVDHLAMCEGCEEYLDQFRQTICALGDLPAETLPGDMRSALLKVIRS